MCNFDMTSPHDNGAGALYASNRCNGMGVLQHQPPITT
jgi:hypothetical protein